MTATPCPQGGGIESINRKNANINFQNMLNNVSSRPEGTAGGGEDSVDIFSRRKTQPMVMIKPQKVGVRDVMPAQPVGVSPTKATPTKTAMRRPPSMADLEGLRVDLSLLQTHVRMGKVARSLLGGRSWKATLCTAHDDGPGAAGRRPLTLNDYKRRQGEF